MTRFEALAAIRASKPLLHCISNLVTANDCANLALAEALRRELQDTDFPLVGHITASFGLADYEAYPGPAALVARADKALYRAKQSGRNQVIVAPTTAAVSRTQ